MIRNTWRRVQFSNCILYELWTIIVYTEVSKPKLSINTDIFNKKREFLLLKLVVVTVTCFFFVLKIIFNVNPDKCCMVIIWIVIKYYVVTSGRDFILLLKFIASFTNVVVYKTDTTKQDKMEMERQYYLEYPFNQEFDHLPVRYFTFLVFHNTGIVLHCIAFNSIKNLFRDFIRQF